jgi:septum formation protein
MRPQSALPTRVAPPAFVYLASQSPRRAQLLGQIGVAHRLLLPGTGAPEQAAAEALEAQLHGELPLAYVQRVTRLKLQAARQRLRQAGLPPAPILCADTTVALGRRILGKPADAAEAAAMLGALAGRSHRVLTAVAVGQGSKTWALVNVSQVRFAPLSAATIAAYVASGEPMGKAGAYAIQGLVASHIASISGSHSGIMGLPLFETATLLRRAGVAVL